MCKPHAEQCRDEQEAHAERLLNCLLHQYTDDIEIIVKDDSTNKDTELLVQKFSKDIPISYYSGIKEGIDKTVIFLMGKASGKFVWWLGDDTIVFNGVSAILDAIKKYPDLNFIWANYRLHNTNLLGIDINKEECLIDKNQLLDLGGAGLGFISATIFRREIGMQAEVRANDYIGTLFSNLFIVLHVITSPGKFLYLRGPIVICHPATSEEVRRDYVSSDGVIKNPAFITFGVNFKNIVSDFEKKFDENVFKRAIKKSFRQAWTGVLVGAIGGWDSTNGKKIILIKNYFMFIESWLVLILFFLPIAVLKPLYKIKKFHDKLLK